ncbi:MAG: N-acetyltransferase [Alphaproteobacteria bacterium]|nr:N-acetyltransferase [Alphaproteobacteria bacterium]
MFQIRLQTPADAIAVETLNDLGFGSNRHGRTVWRFRQGPVADGLALVAAGLEADTPLATLRFWPVTIGGIAPALLLGPLAVCPTRRGQGMGRALVGHGLSKARDLGWTLCLVSGDPRYYQPYGFSSADPHGITLPGPIEAGRFQVVELTPGALAALDGLADRTLQPWRWVRADSTSALSAA